jgi:hypothetical protein
MAILILLEIKHWIFKVLLLCCIGLSPYLSYLHIINIIQSSILFALREYKGQACNWIKQCIYIRTETITHIILSICSFPRWILHRNYAVTPRRDNWIK